MTKKCNSQKSKTEKVNRNSKIDINKNMLNIS